MMQKYFLVLLTLVVATAEAQIQRNCHSSTSGPASRSLAGITVMQCVGQGSVIGTFDNAKTTLRQGFLQPSVSASIAASLSHISVEVYPNPFTREVWLEFDDDRKRECIVSLFGTTGELLYLERLTLIRRRVLNFPDLTSGVYVLRVETDGGTASMKLQKL